MSHTRRKWPKSNIPLLGMVRRYIDQGDERTTGPQGPPGARGPAGPPGPPAAPGTRGPDVPLQPVGPVTSTGLKLTPNPDGSVSLSGNVNATGPFTAGEPVVITHAPAHMGPDRPLSFGQVAWLASARTYVPVIVDLNPASTAPSDVFLLAPDVADGGTLSFDLDSITYWPPIAG